MGGPRTLLVTGAAGQIGSELTTALRERHGTDAVVTSDIGPAADGLDEPCEVVDVTDRAALDAVIEDYDVDTVYHLAAILSAAGERDPQAAYRVNVGGGCTTPWRAAARRASRRSSSRVLSRSSGRRRRTTPGSRRCSNGCRR